MKIRLYGTEVKDNYVFIFDIKDKLAVITPGYSDSVRWLSVLFDNKPLDAILIENRFDRHCTRLSGIEYAYVSSEGNGVVLFEGILKDASTFRYMDKLIIMLYEESEDED